MGGASHCRNTQNVEQLYMARIRGWFQDCGGVSKGRNPIWENLLLLVILVATSNSGKEGYEGSGLKDDASLTFSVYGVGCWREIDTLAGVNMAMLIILAMIYRQI